MWFGLFEPPGTPTAVIDGLNREVSDILKDQTFTDKIAAIGATPMTTTPTMLKTFVAAEVDK